MPEDVRTLELSPLDLIPPKYYTRIALHFSTTQSTEGVLANLQRSLDKTCQSIPWLAGKLVPGTHADTGRPSLHIQWTDNASPKLADLGTLEQSYEASAVAGMPLTTIPDEFWPSTGMVNEELHKAGAPVFAGGLLSFSDGEGVALCLSFHHNVMDAGGMAEVVRLWTEIACGTPIPVLDSDRIGRLASALDTQMQDVSAASMEELMAVQPGYATAPLQFMGLPACSSTILNLSVPKVEVLKAELGRYTVAPVTANTVISALLWCAVTRTRYRRDPAAFENQSSRLGMAVNGRARIHPDFSTANDPYFGNVYVYAMTKLVPEELGIWDDVSPRTLALICDSIAASNAAQSINASHIAGLHSIMSRSEKLPALFPAWSIACGRDFGVTSWANLGLYDMRFGANLGTPDFVRMPYTPLDSAGIILPRKRAAAGDATGCGRIEVVMMLRKEDLEALQADDVWRRIAV